MQLVAFSTVLWSISHLLVAVLALYALLGTVVALWVFGNPLIRMNFWGGSGSKRFSASA